jgi:hypothetical protein
VAIKFQMEQAELVVTGQDGKATEESSILAVATEAPAEIV